LREKKAKEEKGRRKIGNEGGEEGKGNREEKLIQNANLLTNIKNKQTKLNNNNNIGLCGYNSRLHLYSVLRVKRHI
jgi:hypothetical protein